MSLKYSKLSQYKVKKIIHCFCIDLTAQQCSELLKINRNTANCYYLIFRKAIFKTQKSKFIDFLSIQKLQALPLNFTQTNFPKKDKKKIWKEWAIALFESETEIYTCLLKKGFTLNKNQDKIDYNILNDKLLKHNFDAIIDINQNKFTRLNSNKLPLSKSVFSPDNLERFWGFSKQRLNKFNGVNNYFEFHLKECEWRWKKSLKDMDKNLKKLLLIGLSTFVISHTLSNLKLQLIF